MMARGAARAKSRVSRCRLTGAVPSPHDRRSPIAAAGRRRVRREMRNLAEVLIGLRLDAGLSQSAVAQAGGISRAYVSAIEAGLRTPSGDVLARRAAALGGDPSGGS